MPTKVNPDGTVKVDWEGLAATGAGAADEILFGLPEYIAKKVNREAVEKYIKEHEKAYKTGETIGTVGSMFIPVPGAGMVKAGGAAAKMLKGAKAIDTAADTARAAKLLPSVAKMAGKGALAGAAEAGVRGVTSEKSAGDILGDIQAGATFGAAGGALGGLAAKGAKKVGKRLEDWAGEADKLSDKAIIGMTPMAGRDTKTLLKEMSGPGAKGLGQFKNRDMTRERLADIIRENKLYQIGADDRYLGKVQKDWDDIRNAFDIANPGESGAGIISKALSKDPKVLKEIKKLPDGETALASINKILGETKDLQGLNVTKKYLDGIWKDTYNPNRVGGENAANAQRDLVSAIRRGIDEMSIEAAEKAGLNIDFDKLKKNYIFDRKLGEAIARADVAPLRVNTGSQTAEKLGANLALAGLTGATGGVVGLSGTSADTPLEDRLKRAGITALGAGAAGLAGGAIKKGFGDLATSAIAHSKPAAELAGRLAPKAAALLEKVPEAMGAQIGGEIASVASRAAREEAAPKTPKEAEAVETATAAETDTPKYMNIIRDKMVAYAEALGVPEDSDEFREFAAQVYAMTDGFSPDKIGGILYTDPEERKAYETSLRVARGIKEESLALEKRPGMFQGQTEEEKLARETSIANLSGVIEEVAKAKGPTATAYAKKAVSKILAGDETPERKQELLGVILEQYGVNLDDLSALGVV